MFIVSSIGSMTKVVFWGLHRKNGYYLEILVAKYGLPVCSANRSAVILHFLAHTPSFLLCCFCIALVDQLQPQNKLEIYINVDQPCKVHRSASLTVRSGASASESFAEPVGLDSGSSTGFTYLLGIFLP